MKRYKISISGRVQGVFFRDSANTMAKKLKISGFVMNEPDGSVFMEAEGKEEDLQEFIKWCKNGPSAARVKEVLTSEMPLKNINGFTIKYQ